MSMQEVLTSLIERSGVKTVYGDPVTAGDVTIVPAAKVVYGFGGGQGKGDREGQAGEGSGGGGGYVGKPAGYIEMTPGRTRWVLLDDRKRLVAALAFGVVIGWVLGRFRRSA
jgi:uncharacterized spore protein YtfJ